MQLHEARQLADLLDVPLVQVLTHAGVAMPEEGVRTVPIAGFITPVGDVHLTEGRREMVSGPSDLPGEAIAIRFHTAQSQYDLLDGWIVFAEKPAPPKPDVIGKLCIVSTRNHGKTASCSFVLRGYKPGTYNLVPWRPGLGKQAESAVLEWAASVIWIRPL